MYLIQISCTVSDCRACKCDFFPYASKIITGAVVAGSEMFHYFMSTEQLKDLTLDDIIFALCSKAVSLKENLFK